MQNVLKINIRLMVVRFNIITKIILVILKFEHITACGIRVMLCREYLEIVKFRLSSVLTPIKQEYYSKFRLLIMRLIFPLKLDLYPDSIFPLV